MKRGQREENLELSTRPAEQGRAGGRTGLTGRDWCPLPRQEWCLVRSQGTWRCTRVALPREMLTLRVRFPAGAGGGAQAGSAGAADGEEAGTISALSVLGASSPPAFSSARKKEKKCPLHLLASTLLSVFPLPGTDPGNHLCPPQLCLHIWSYSRLVLRLRSLKKGFKMNQGIS